MLAHRKVPSTHTDFRAHRRGMNRESFPNNPAAVDCQRHVLLYISAGKLINRPAFDYDSDDFILGLFLGVQASYAAIMMAELTSLCLSTTLLIAIYQVS